MKRQDHLLINVFSKHLEGKIFVNCAVVKITILLTGVALFSRHCYPCCS